VIRVVNHFFFEHSIGALHLPALAAPASVVAVPATGSFELKQGYSLRHTYCMHMHKINIMDV
jgi:hypothetical protein